MQRARAVAVVLAWVAGFSIGCGKQQPAVDFQGADLASMPRIRWAIEEDTLLARRSIRLRVRWSTGASRTSPTPRPARRPRSTSATAFYASATSGSTGSGGGFEIPDIQPDGRPTCVYGTDGLGKGHFVVDPDVVNGCDSAEDADYVVFESSRSRTPYVAVKVRPNLELNLEEEQVGFQLLRRLASNFF